MPLQFKPSILRVLIVLLVSIFFAATTVATETVKSTSIERYHQALKVDPGNPTLHYILGLAQLNNGEAAAALASFRSAYPAYTDSIELHYNMGLAFSQAGDADSALLYLEQAEALGALKMENVFPLVNAYYNVALIYLEQEALEEAKHLFNRVLILDPDRVEIQRLLGDISARNGNFDEAVFHFNNYLVRYPDDQSAREYLYALHFNRALKQMEEGQNVAARTSFESAQVIAPDSPLILYYLGSIFYNSGDAEAAVHHLAPAYLTVPVELKSSTRSMLYNSALRSLESKKLDQAVAGITPLIQPTDARTKDLMLAGSIYLQRQEFKTALEMFNRVLAIEPTHPQATINVAVAEDKAVEELFQEGLIAYKQGDFTDALVFFDAVLSIQPGERRSAGYKKNAIIQIESEAKGRFEKAQQALLRNDYLKAVGLINEGLSLAPTNPEGLRLKRETLLALNTDIHLLLVNGFDFLQRSDFSAAEAQFSKVIEIDPDNAKAQTGLSQSKQNRQTKALAETKKGNTALDEGKLEAADRHFTQAEKLIADLPETIDGRARLDALISSLVAQELQLGRRVLSAGDLNQAEIHFNNALKLKDSNEIRRELEAIRLARNDRSEGLLIAARTARQQKDFKTARSIYSRILTANPQHPAAIELKQLNVEIATVVASKLDRARKLSNQGQYQEALNFYRQVLDLEPTNKIALQGLQTGREQLKTEIAEHLQTGRSAFEQGDFKIATEAYNRALQLDPYQAEAKAALTRIASLEQTGIRPGDENSLYLQGIELYTQGKYLEAIRSWEKVLQLAPEHDKARMNIEKTKRKLQSIQEFGSG